MGGLIVFAKIFLAIAGPIVAIVAAALKVINEYERGVLFRLGRILPSPKLPGLRLVIPFVDRMVRVSLRLIVMDVPPQDIITRDNVSVNVNAVVYFRVVDANSAVLTVENYIEATSQLAQTTLRSVLGTVDLDELLSQREKLNAKLQELLDRHTDPWGIKVTNVEVKHVDLPTEMRRAMARQAEAERERRAKVIAAEGEFQAAQRMTDAAEIMESHPMALQMRYLQTLAEIATENNSTTIFPLPLDLIAPFLSKLPQTKSRHSALETED
ncbi:MAG: slipin family protein [Candidatus Schekmanbacteria bacterium]|nr:slipin family protein [Candidatus Schekmanbacteria bacterium]